MDQVLSIFEQRNFVEDATIVKDFMHPIKEEEIKLMTDILHFSGTDPATRKQIEIEEEALRTFNFAVEKDRQEYVKAIEEKERMILEKDQALKAKDEAIIEKDQAITKKDKLIKELLKKLDSNQ